jgi:hypothetical protein
MAAKRPVSFRIHPRLEERFRQGTKAYYGKLGTCFSAALLMFLEADPKVQGQYVKRVFEAELDDEIDATVEAAKSEQAKRIKSREQGGGGHGKR